MIISGSKRPPEETAAKPLGALLRGLRLRGLTVGPDDAARVAAVFVHSAQWPHARKVRALKALLARSDAESRMIDDLSHLLFVAADRSREDAMDGQAETPRRLPVQEESPLGPPGGEEAEPAADLSPEKKRFLFYRRTLFGLLCLALLSLLVVLVSAYRSRTPEASLAEERKIVATDFRTLGLPPETAAFGAAGKPKPGPRKPAATGPGKTLQPGPDATVATAPPPPPETPQKSLKERRAEERNHAFLQRNLYPLFLFVAFAGSTALIFVRRLVRVERARLNVVALANSPGPRTYRMELDVPLHPMDREMVRELVARLSNFAIETAANRVDEDRTVKETARRAGRLDFFYQKQREYRPVLFIEDVSLSMARWPGVGAQILQGLVSQGCEVVHRFMEGSPGRLAKDPDLRQGIRLSEALAGLTEPIVLVLSDLHDLDSVPAREQTDWLGPLRQAVWLHPCGVELWGAGAWWLSEQVAVLAVCDANALQLSARLREEKGFIRPWKAPRVVEGASPEAVVLALREALGEAALLWLGAGAVLDEIGALTIRNWWALRNQEIAPVPIDRLQRALSLPLVAVRADGSVALPEDLRRALIHHLHRENPALLSSVVLWGDRVLSQDLARLPASSLAAVLARALQARLSFADPARRRQGFRKMKSLEREGYGAWLDQKQRFFTSVLISAPQTMPWAGPAERAVLSAASVRSTVDTIVSYLQYRAREVFGSAQGFSLMYWQIVSEQVNALSELGLILLGVLPLFFATLSYHWINQEIQRVQIRAEKLEQQLSVARDSERELRLEASYLMSPRLIESRAAAELGMRYPALEQMIFWDEIPGPTAPAPSSSKASDPATPRR